MLDEKKTLRNLPLFTELGINELREISSFSVLKNFDKNDFIFLEGDKYTGFYILLKGTVKVFKVSPGGRESILHVINPPNSFADFPLFEGLVEYPVSAQALKKSVLLFVPRNEFIQFTRRYPEICFKIIAGFAKKMMSLTQRIEALTVSDVPNRLAKYILTLNKEQNKSSSDNSSVTLSISKSTLAGYLGTINETLSRTFKKLSEENIIKVEGNIIHILNIKELKKTAS